MLAPIRIYLDHCSVAPQKIICRNGFFSHSASSNNRIIPKNNAGKHNRVRPDADVVADKDRKPSRSIQIGAKAVLMRRRPHIVADRDIRADETVASKLKTWPHRYALRDDTAVAELRAVERCTRRHVAIFPKNRTPDDTSELPYSCSGTDRRAFHMRFRMHNRSRMDAQTIPAVDRSTP